MYRSTARRLHFSTIFRRHLDSYIIPKLAVIDSVQRISGPRAPSGGNEHDFVEVWLVNRSIVAITCL